jgi:Na+/H+-dicarboxylate symporter
MMIVGWAMKLAPIAVFALISMRIGFGAIIGIGAYIGTVVLGLVILLIFYLVMVSFRCLGRCRRLVFCETSASHSCWLSRSQPRPQ